MSEVNPERLKALEALSKLDQTLFDDDPWPSDLEIADLRLVCTCSACPEQYDVFDGDTQVGYLRLRHGYFRADYPDCGGETVYEADTVGDGVFAENERMPQLEKAVAALIARHKKGIS